MEKFSVKKPFTILVAVIMVLLQMCIRDSDCGVIEGAALCVYPAAAQTAPACGLVGGVHRAHRAKLREMLFCVGVGAAALGQPAHLSLIHI